MLSLSLCSSEPVATLGLQGSRLPALSAANGFQHHWSLQQKTPVIKKRKRVLAGSNLSGAICEPMGLDRVVWPLTMATSLWHEAAEFGSGGTNQRPSQAAPTERQFESLPQCVYEESDGSFTPTSTVHQYRENRGECGLLLLLIQLLSAYGGDKEA